MKVEDLLQRFHPDTVEELLQLEEEEARDFVHASQDAPCETCGKRLGDHPMAESILGWQNRPFLHMDCRGRLYKL